MRRCIRCWPVGRQIGGRGSAARVTRGDYPVPSPRADQAHTRPIAGGRMLSDRGIEVGTEVEVRNRFTGEWSVGFEVVGRADGFFHVRRLRDGAILPAAFR